MWGRRKSGPREDGCLKDRGEALGLRGDGSGESAQAKCQGCRFRARYGRSLMSGLQDEGRAMYRSNPQGFAERAERGLRRDDSGVRGQPRVRDGELVGGCRGMAAEEARVPCYRCGRSQRAEESTRAPCRVSERRSVGSRETLQQRGGRTAERGTRRKRSVAGRGPAECLGRPFRGPTMDPVRTGKQFQGFRERPTEAPGRNARGNGARHMRSGPSLCHVRQRFT